MKILVVIVFAVALSNIYGSRFERTLTKLSYDVVFENNFMPQMMIFDFDKNSKTRDWRIVDDVVMGGVSKSNITINKDAVMVYFLDTYLWITMVDFRQ